MSSLTPSPPKTRPPGLRPRSESGNSAVILGEALCAGAAALRGAGIENPRLEARLLLAHALGVTPEIVLRDRHLPMEVGPFDALVSRRAVREPLALILGRREFWSLEFAVSRATLVPRADSETLIEACVAAFADRGRVARILDLGTGTGCLLLAALTEFPQAFGVGVDCVAAAVVLAAANAQTLGLAGRAGFVCADWAAPIGGDFDIVLSNPPYIRTDELAGLMPEVARHEPATALDGGVDGLAMYRLLAGVLPRLLAPEGIAVIELGAGQAAAVGGLAAAAGLSWSTRDDLAGTARALVARRERKYKKPFGSRREDR